MNKLTKFSIGAILSIFAIGFSPDKAFASQATTVDISVTASNGQNTAKMLDGSYYTEALFNANDTITVSSQDKMYGLYIFWNSDVSPWNLEYNAKTISCGNNGYLHEYIPLDGTTQCNLTLPSGGDICCIYAYSDGDLPNDVQIWQKPCDSETDILVFSTHADDEILFLGGILTNYAYNQKLNVQVAYLCDFFKSESCREHEKLDGLWTCGVVNYPVKGDFGDYGSRSLSVAMSQYNYDEVLSYTVDCIRRFKPLVVATQDVDGEYGHGGHMLFVKAVMEAVDNSNISTFNSESATQYGVWEVKKTYLHLYNDNKITLDIKSTLNNSSKNSISVLQEAYDKHVSQHQWDFAITNEGFCSTGSALYDVSAFGLYKSTVGLDTGNDMLENIKTYEKVKEELKLEQESLNATTNSTENDIIEEDLSSNSEDEKPLRMSSRQLLINIIAIFIIVVIVGFQFSRVSKLYDKKVDEYKKDKDKSSH